MFRGEILQRILTFLCGQHWSDPDSDPTQYDIAEAIYGSVDEVDRVRNGVKRVRERLKLYYADEGKDSTLQLDIPPGAYRIVFKSVGSDRPQGVAEAPSSPSRPVFIRWAAWTIVLMVLVTWVAWIAMETTDSGDRTPVEAFIPLGLYGNDEISFLKHWENSCRGEFREGQIYSSMELLGQRGRREERISLPVNDCSGGLIADINGDGIPEILLSTGNLGGSGEAGRIIIFDSQGTLAGGPIKAWEESPYFESDGVPPFMGVHLFCLLNLDSDPVLEIAALSFHKDHDDCCLTLIDLLPTTGGLWTGEIIGTYWHPGHLRLLVSQDEDGDGVADWVAASGVCNPLGRQWDEKTQLSLYKNIVVVLDVPRVIESREEGVTCLCSIPANLREPEARYGSDAEELYLAFPVHLTEKREGGITSLEFGSPGWLRVGVQALEDRCNCIYHIDHLGSTSPPLGDRCREEFRDYRFKRLR